MIEEDHLTHLLEQLGASFEVPNEARDAILEAANPAAHEAGGRRAFAFKSLVPSTNKGKGILAAAALVALLAGGITVAAEQANSSSQPTAGGTAAENGSATPYGDGQPALPPERSAQRRAPVAGLSGTGAGGSAAPKAAANPQVPPKSSQAAKVVANGTVDLTVKTGTLQTVLAELTELAASYGGFVANTQAQYGQSSPPMPASGTIVLRVPESSFGSAVTRVQRYGEATSVNTTSNDVTGQYVDLQARISAARASLNQYLTILRQATTIPDILSVQDQINAIQSNIDQMQGQLNVLNDETTYGTLTVSLSEPAAKSKPKPKAKPRPKPSGVTTAWHDGVGGFVSGFEWFIRILGPVLITGLILAALVLLAKRTWRVARRRTI